MKINEFKLNSYSTNLLLAESSTCPKCGDPEPFN